MTDDDHCPVQSTPPELPEWATLTRAEYEARFTEPGFGTPEQTIARMRAVLAGTGIA